MNTGRKIIKDTSPKMGTRGFWEKGFWAEGTCSFWPKRNTLLANIGRKTLLGTQKTPKGTHFWQNRKGPKTKRNVGEIDDDRYQLLKIYLSKEWFLLKELQRT
jgi:hypothetical protein